MSTARPSELSRTSDVVAKYGKAYEFCDKFTPDLQLRYHKNLRAVVETESVSLTKVAQAYGESDMKFWLKLQISELGKIFKGGDDDMMNKLADMIYTARPDLKVTEIMAFLGGVSMGEYGEVYGFDAYQIIRLLPNFIRKRNLIMEEIAQEQRKREAEEHAKRAITREEYEELKRKENEQGRNL